MFFIGHPATAGLPGEVHDSQRNPLGMVALGSDGIEYIYLQGSASVAEGSWVTFDTAGLSALLAADAIGPVAIATAAIVAAKYGWFVWDTHFATCSALMAANSAASGRVGREGADGSVGDGRAAGDELHNVIAPASTSAGLYTGVRTFRAYCDNSTGS